jgi:uncharacterized protein YecT (DUF1311 family)
MRKIVIVLLLVASGPMTRLHGQHMNEPDSPCAGIGMTAELTDCLSKAKKKADAELNALYTNLRKRLDSSDKQRSTDTERLWVKYRDANCSAEEALYEGGTARYPAYYGCLEAMTRARIKELNTTYAVALKD